MWWSLTGGGWCCPGNAGAARCLDLACRRHLTICPWEIILIPIGVDRKSVV